MRDNGRTVSQDRFAEMLGVSRRSPGRWENGEAEPRMAQLSRIAEITGRPVGFFFDEPVDSDPFTVVGATIADVLRSQVSAAISAAMTRVPAQ